MDFSASLPSHKKRAECYMQDPGQNSSSFFKNQQNASHFSNKSPGYILQQLWPIPEKAPPLRSLQHARSLAVHFTKCYTHEKIFELLMTFMVRLIEKSGIRRQWRRQERTPAVSRPEGCLAKEPKIFPPRQKTKGDRA
jgi:hypothetical protein